MDLIAKISMECGLLRLTLISGLDNYEPYIKKLKRLVKEYRKKGYDEDVLRLSLKRSQIRLREHAHQLADVFLSF